MSNQINAIQLAIKFSETSDLPLRFKEKKVEEDNSKANSNTLIKKPFPDKVKVEASDLPLLFKEKKTVEEKAKPNFNTLIEKRFQEKVKIWEKTITTMLKKHDNKKAWRYLNLKPLSQTNIKSAAYHSDFIEFTDYLILRRDIENCDSDELGCLASLHTAFQREIEKTLTEK